MAHERTQAEVTCEDDAIDDSVRIDTVTVLLEEVRGLREEVTHLHRKVKRLENRSGRGIVHPSEAFALDVDA